MGFLTPALLFLGTAIAVPLILHLFQRHQGPRMIFPAVRYLRRAEKESARRIRLRQILLLALRIAALLVLAAAAARPFIRSGGAGHEPTAVALILDNSLSSGAIVDDRRVLDVLKARALETLAAAGPDDRFWLIRAGAPWEPAIPGSAAALTQAVRETELSGGASNLTASIARARAVLASGADRRATEIQVLSDLQATAFTSPIDAGRGAPALVVWAANETPPANAAVSSVLIAGGLPPRAGERANVSAMIDGTNTGDSVGVRLSVEGRVTAATHAPVGSAAVLPFPQRNPGIVSGYVEIDPDALRADNRRYFVTDVQPPPSVAITQPVEFLSDALSVLADAERITRVTGDADVVIAPSGVGAEAVNRRRTAVIIAPESPLELAAINRRLGEQQIPWRLGAPVQSGEARFPAGNANDELSLALERAQVRQVYPLQPESGADRDTVLVRLRDGSPWIVRGETAAGGRYIIVASPMTAQATSLPTSPAMVPLVDRLVGAWATSLGVRPDIAPGELVPLPEGADEVQTPGNTREKIDDVRTYRAPGATGVYRVYAAGRQIGAFAVNSPARESDLRTIAGRRVRALLPGWDVETADSQSEWGNDIFQRRFGRELWRVLIILALLVLAAEAFAGAAGRQTGHGLGDTGDDASESPRGATQRHDERKGFAKRES